LHYIFFYGGNLGCKHSETIKAQHYIASKNPTHKFFFFKQTPVHKLKRKVQRELGGQEPNPATT
jgi:hypothetical protein